MLPAEENPAIYTADSSQILRKNRTTRRSARDQLPSSEFGFFGLRSSSPPLPRVDILLLRSDSAGLTAATTPTTSPLLPASQHRYVCARILPLNLAMLIDVPART
jgi:hypothetical protein